MGSLLGAVVPGAIAGASSITIACASMSGWAFFAIVFVATCMRETREEQLDSAATAGSVGRATTKGEYELVGREEEDEQGHSEDEAADQGEEREGGDRITRQGYGEIR